MVQHGIIERMSDNPDLDQRVRAWVQAEADAHFGGDFAAANRAILRAAYLAEQEPGDPWAGLNARIAERRPRRGQESRAT